MVSRLWLHYSFWITIYLYYRFSWGLWFHCLFLFLFAGLCLRVDVWMVRGEGRYPPCPPGMEIDVAGPVILFT